MSQLFLFCATLHRNAHAGRDKRGENEELRGKKRNLPGKKVERRKLRDIEGMKREKIERERKKEKEREEREPWKKEKEKKNGCISKCKYWVFLEDLQQSERNALYRATIFPPKILLKSYLLFVPYLMHSH